MSVANLGSGGSHDVRGRAAELLAIKPGGGGARDGGAVVGGGGIDTVTAGVALAPGNQAEDCQE